MYKVFFNDRIVFINSEPNDVVPENALVRTVSEHDSCSFIWKEFLNDDGGKNLYLTSDNSFDLMKWFSSNFRIIKAAGGVVFNKRKAKLCIFRMGKWDLPKGKIEKGESIEAAAIREVAEETGIKETQIETALETTYHIYQSPHHNKQWVLKPTYWFRMNYTGNAMPVPQAEEAITQVRWVESKDIDEIAQQTYPSLESLFRQF